jgi:hypothetical protein
MGVVDAVEELFSTGVESDGCLLCAEARELIFFLQW